MSGSSKSRDQRTLLYILLIALCVVLIILLLSRLIKGKENNAATVADLSGEFIAFLDVGQGNGALIKSGESSGVVDTGTPESAAAFCDKLKKCGVGSINTLLLTHNHDDHVGGAAKVSEAFRIDDLILPDISNTNSPTGIINAATNGVISSGGDCRTARSGMFFTIGDIKLTILCCYYEFSNENERSIVSIADMGGKRFLFTGDAGKQTENRVLKDGIDVDCDVLGVGHHGSKNSSTARFLAAASPDYAVISCGEHNSYNHPNEEAVERLVTVGAMILRTDQSGDITFFIKDNSLVYSTEK